ncbi:MAG: phosphatase PAP2 family protein [Rickettsiaceae bacterium]|nr:phosphatase PAP2 family protein [Rickettsiaceae bacterium]
MRIRIFFACIIFPLSFSSVAFSKDRYIRKIGDILQFTNPMFGTAIASQNKGTGHFLYIYSEGLGITYASKLTGKIYKPKTGKRPYKKNKKPRYDGLPSGHTYSAWASASYVRNFSNEYNQSAPLYLAAIFTAYSRVESREHTISQVVAAALLAEIVNSINSKLEWNKEYRYISITPLEKTLGINIEIRL